MAPPVVVQPGGLGGRSYSFSVLPFGSVRSTSPLPGVARPRHVSVSSLAPSYCPRPIRPPFQRRALAASSPPMPFRKELVPPGLSLLRAPSSGPALTTPSTGPPRGLWLLTGPPGSESRHCRVLRLPLLPVGPLEAALQETGPRVSAAPGPGTVGCLSPPQYELCILSMCCIL